MSLQNKKKEWRYVGAVCKEYSITRYQVRQAIDAGVIVTKKTRNPFNSQDKVTLVRDGDIQMHLEDIKKLPRYQRKEDPLKKLRDVKCPFCCKKCLPDQRQTVLKSETAEAFRYGEIPFNEAKLAVLINHIRHVHTDYGRQLKNYGMKRKQMIDSYRDLGYEYEAAAYQADYDLEKSKFPYPDHPISTARAYDLLQQNIALMDMEFQLFFVKHENEYKKFHWYDLK